MPKMKTHKGTAKRVKLTGSGKVTRRHSGGRHMLAKKSQRRKRVIGSGVVITGQIAKNIKRALGVK